MKILCRSGLAFQRSSGSSDQHRSSGLGEAREAGPLFRSSFEMPFEHREDLEDIPTAQHHVSDSGDEQSLRNALTGLSRRRCCRKYRRSRGCRALARPTQGDCEHTVLGQLSPFRTEGGWTCIARQSSTPGSVSTGRYAASEAVHGLFDEMRRTDDRNASRSRLVGGDGRNHLGVCQHLRLFRASICV